MEERNEQTQHVPNGEQGTPPSVELDLQKRQKEIKLNVTIEYTVSKIISSPGEPLWKDEHVAKRYRELEDADQDDRKTITDAVNARINECAERGWDSETILRLMTILTHLASRTRRDIQLSG